MPKLGELPETSSQKTSSVLGRAEIPVPGEQMELQGQGWARDLPGGKA